MKDKKLFKWFESQLGQGKNASKLAREMKMTTQELNDIISAIQAEKQMKLLAWHQRYLKKSSESFALDLAEDIVNDLEYPDSVEAANLLLEAWRWGKKH